MAYRKINVDTVYQKVLAVANKEQRGYITPQEFNLFAKQAQQEVFDNYFHDVKMAYLKPKNQSDVGDELNMIHEKLSIHRNVNTTAIVESVSEPYIYTTPESAYNVTSVNFTNASGQVVEIPEVKRSELHYMLLNPLTSPTLSRPVFVRASSGDVEIHPASFTTNINIHYIERPEDPLWGYVVISGKALYNSNASTDFDLHQSEENNLVMRILTLAGISMKDQLLTGTVMQDAANTENNKNN